MTTIPPDPWMIVIMHEEFMSIDYLVVQQYISSCSRADNLALAWIPSSPNQFPGSPFKNLNAALLNIG